MLPYSKFRKGDLKMIDWPKHVVIDVNNIN